MVSSQIEMFSDLQGHRSFYACYALLSAQVGFYPVLSSLIY